MKTKVIAFLALGLISVGIFAQEKSTNTVEILRGMSTAISRMDATTSILSVVIPRCQESNLGNFYKDFGNLFLEKYPPVMGTLDEIHRTLLIKRFGEGAANRFDKLRKDIKLEMFFEIKQEFNQIDKAQLDSICKNFYNQIQSDNYGVYKFAEIYMNGLEKIDSELFNQSKKFLELAIRTENELNLRKKRI
jgi:hypothetical protein